MASIIQHGTDGFGHQLYGLYTTLVFCNEDDYYFDGMAFCKKDFSFDHISSHAEADDLKNYLIKSISLFSRDNHQIDKQYSKCVHAHEIFKIPKKFDSSILYSVDNAFVHKNVMWESASDDRQIRWSQNIRDMKKYFINDQLPANRLVKNNVVIHVRLGDAIIIEGRRDSISNYNNSLMKLLPILQRQYPDHKFYVHSDGDASFLEPEIKNVVFFPKNTHMLELLSDFIHAKILLCSNSALSKVCSFFGEKELTLVHDDNIHMVSENAKRVSDYISEYKV
jgi:hypothetical protein